MQGMASAAVQMPAWFSDNMVLQTNAEYGARAFLSGQAAPGEVVQVNVTGGMSHFGGSYTAVASDAGSWTLQLNPSSSTNPCDIYVQGETDATPIVARGVHFGDVFFCSGQSNSTCLRLACLQILSQLLCGCSGVPALAGLQRIRRNGKFKTIPKLPVLYDRKIVRILARV